MPKISANPRTKYWVFTINNPVAPPVFNADKVEYAVYQKEVGESGTPHYQGYVEFKDKIKRSNASKQIPHAYLAPREGSQQQARDYCMSTGAHANKPRLEGPFEFGIFKPTSQGQRNDLLVLREDLLAKTLTPQEIVDKHFVSYMKYKNNIQWYKNTYLPERRNWPMEITLYIGPKGTGKSRACNDAYPDAFWKNKGKWWDGYNNQETVIMDDYYGWLPFDDLFRLLDRYPLWIEQKGSSIPFLSKRILLTSNRPPWKWYNNPNCDMPALFRRINKVVWCRTAIDHVVYDNGEESVNDFKNEYVHPSPSDPIEEVDLLSSRDAPFPDYPTNGPKVTEDEQP